MNYHAQIVTIKTKEGIKRIPVIASPVGLLTGKPIMESGKFPESI